MGDPALSFNGAKTVTHKHSFNSSAINERAKEARKRETVGIQMEKKKILTIIPSTTLFYKKFKKYIKSYHI